MATENRETRGSHYPGCSQVSVSMTNHNATIPMPKRLQSIIAAPNSQREAKGIGKGIKIASTKNRLAFGEAWRLAGSELGS
jgi:hypothetical protein